MIIKARVSVYSGTRYADRPTAFEIEGKSFKVDKVIRSWREPGVLKFQVRIKDGRLFYLTYDETKEYWRIQIQP